MRTEGQAWEFIKNEKRREGKINEGIEEGSMERIFYGNTRRGERYL